MRELPADLETPVSTYLKLTGSGPSFLLELVTGGEQVARYSFIGVHPSQAFVLRGETIEEHTSAGVSLRTAPDPLAALQAELEKRPVETLPGMPRFAGGLAGYLNYEMMRFFEPSVALTAPCQPAGWHFSFSRHPGGLRPRLRTPAADRQPGP